MRKLKAWQWIVGLVALLGAAVIGALGLVFGGALLARRMTIARERELSADGQLAKVGRALALYCNSTDRALGRDLGLGWLPPELQALEPSDASVEPTRAELAFGGGFHGAGIGLRRTTPGRFEVTFSSEDQWTTSRSLVVEQDARLSEAELMDALKTNYRRYVEVAGSGDAQLQRRLAQLRFLSILGSTGELRAAALDAVTRMPNRLEAHLALGVVESVLGSDEEATKVFSEWVAANPSFYREVVLTDFLVVRRKHERALSAARDALTRPLTYLPEQRWNYSALGATLVADILPLDPDLALQLCDKLEREESDTSARRDFQPTFAVLRQQALARKSGQSETKTVPPEGTFPPLDFEREFLGQGFRDAIADRRREAVDPRPPP